MRRVKYLKSKLQITHNFEFGNKPNLKALTKKHDTVLIATGVSNTRAINLEGSNLKNIYPAMEFLTASNKKGLGDAVEEFDNGNLNCENKNVVVIGGVIQDGLC